MYQFILYDPLQTQYTHFVYQCLKGRLFTLMDIPTTVKNTTVLSNDQCLTEARHKSPETLLQITFYLIFFFFFGGLFIWFNI